MNTINRVTTAKSFQLSDKPKAPELLLCILKGQARKVDFNHEVFIECHDVLYDRNKNIVVST